MPTIYRRKDSSIWWATYTDCDGNRRRESLGTRDKELARLALAKRENLHYMAREGFISRDQLRTHDKGKTALDTLAPERVTRTFIAWARLKTANDFGGDTVVAKLSEWISEQDDLQPRTRNKKLWAIQAFGDRLWREGYITSNASLRVKAARESSELVKPHRAFTPVEAQRLIDGAPEQYRLFYLLRFWTGLRGSEARLIERRDLNLGEHPSLTVRPEIAKNRMGGTIPLPQVLDASLAGRSMLAPTTPIFRDLPASDNRRDKHLRRHLDALGFDEQINGRSFRMTFVSWLEAAGVELGVRMKLRRDKGSDSVRLTNVVYSDPKMVAHILREGMAKLEGWHGQQMTAAKAVRA